MGKIFYIKDGATLPQKVVLESWQKTLFLKKERKVPERGWTIDLMNCVERLGKNDFSLSEVYIFEKDLQRKHPRNLHIKDKIRQQLQILRDSNYLEFLGRGRYRLL